MVFELIINVYTIYVKLVGRECKQKIYHSYKEEGVHMILQLSYRQNSNCIVI